MKTSKLRYYLLQLAIIMSITSQMPLLRVVGGFSTQLLNYPAWLCLVLVSLIQGVRIGGNFLKHGLLPYFLFILVISILEVFEGERYLLAGLSTQIYLSLVLLWLGYCNKDVLVTRFKELAKVYFTLSVLLAFDIYWEYFRTYSFETIDYIFRAKNSAAFILLVGIIFAFVFIGNLKKLYRLLVLGGILFSMYMIFAMRSRAVILALLVFLVYWLITSKGRLKYLLFFSLIGVGVVIYLVPELNDLIIQNILFNGKGNKGINEISSNRFEYLSLLRIFQEYWLVGVGGTYLDNFYIEAVLNYGLVGGALAIYLAFKPSILLLKNKTNVIYRFAGVLALIHVLNAAFEGYAPYGPGTKCFVLWLFYGLYYKMKGEKEC